MDPGFVALKRYGDHQQQEILETETEEITQPHRPLRIRCPRCGWEPDGRAHWICTSPVENARPCGTLWNTFDTRGVCPTCHVQWLDTVCPKCHRWSKHEDWYEKSSESPS